MKDIDLSRRRVLAGLGTVGVAAAGAGLGTSAYFNDTETFKNNTLTAGALDLKLDWEEHYYDQSSGGDLVHYTQPSDNGTYVGLPDPTDPDVWVAADDLSTFMDATALESYPDSDNNRIQDDIAEFDFCANGADTPKDLDPTNSLRSQNEDTWDSANSTYKPLVSLGDLKPGDFGELTLSFHLCDNPGYVWMQGDLVSANENSVTEPESQASGEDGVANSTDPANVELLDAIETMLWYDENGDNVFQPSGQGQEVDVVLVLDNSGSMDSSGKLAAAQSAAKSLVDALTLGSNAGQVGVVTFNASEALVQGLSTDATTVKNQIDGITASGSTNMEGGVNAGEEELRGSEANTDFSDITPSGNDRPGADKVMVVLSDGAPNVNDNSTTDYTQDSGDSPLQEATRAKNDGIELYTIGLGISSGSTQATLLQNMATDSSHAYLGGTGDLTNIFGQISQQIAGEEAFFRGTLRELLGLLSTANGIPLDGDRATPYDEVTGSSGSFALGDGTDDARECFVNSTTNAVGLAWWIPTSVGNEIQTDSVEFDLGFYTEQCRHNSGAGTSPT